MGIPYRSACPEILRNGFSINTTMEKLFIFIPVRDSAIAASCDEPLAAGRVGRTPRGGSTQRATPRGLDCGWLSCAASGKVELVSVHLCDGGHRASPTSPRLERGVTCGVEQRKERKLLCPKPLRTLRIPRRVVVRSGSTFHGETALRLLRRRRKALLCL